MDEDTKIIAEAEATPPNPEQEAEAQAEAKPDNEAAALETAAASALKTIVPEDKMYLIPDGLTLAQKLEHAALLRQKGVFDKPAPVSGPDTKRPGTKRIKGTSGMSPMQKIMAGLS